MEFYPLWSHFGETITVHNRAQLGPVVPAEPLKLGLLCILFTETAPSGGLKQDFGIYSVVDV